MAIFDYKCEKCGSVFEKRVEKSDDKVKCEKCQSSNTSKQLSAFAVKSSNTASHCEPMQCPMASQCPSAGHGCS